MVVGVSFGIFVLSAAFGAYLLLAAPPALVQQSGWLAVAWTLVAGCLGSALSARSLGEAFRPLALRLMLVAGWTTLVFAVAAWKLTPLGIAPSFLLTTSPVTLPPSLLALWRASRGQVVSSSTGSFQWIAAAVCGVAILHLAFFFNRLTGGTMVFLVLLASLAALAASRPQLVSSPTLESHR